MSGRHAARALKLRGLQNLEAARRSFPSLQFDLFLLIYCELLQKTIDTENK